MQPFVFVIVLYSYLLQFTKYIISFSHVCPFLFNRFMHVHGQCLLKYM